MKQNIFVGETHGRLEVLDIFSKISKQGKRVQYCNCLCSCGNTTTLTKLNLVYGYTKSCGCLRNKLVSDRTKTHGLSNDRKFIDAFYSPMKRIKKDYHYKNIKFLLGNIYLFKEKMYESYLKHCSIYGKDNTSLDRVNTYGDYSYDNIRWATRKIQNNNQGPRKDQKPFIIHTEKGTFEFINKLDASRFIGCSATSINDWLNGIKPKKHGVLSVNYK